ncbi:MAG: MarR family transcriptional regulator [Gemmatimonadetes bacterium]|mgnify:CR=1 FL=1|jgi:MarR family transcriptional regulator, 2-MHQ and catechol-resistance regulon repressor|nr:MarR family transcriptional regulator [Gemmatimonadota bacterium]
MGTHFNGTEREVRALDAYIKLLRATESVVARLSHQLRDENGLTVSQFGALEALLHLGPMSQRDLGTKLLKSSGNITMVVDNLEKRDLVERRREGNDRRVVTVHLTPKGRQLIVEVFPRHATLISDELEILTPEEQETLGRLCRKLGLKQ